MKEVVLLSCYVFHLLYHMICLFYNHLVEWMIRCLVDWLLMYTWLFDFLFDWLLLFFLFSRILLQPILNVDLWYLWAENVRVNACLSQRLKIVAFALFAQVQVIDVGEELYEIFRIADAVNFLLSLLKEMRLMLISHIKGICCYLCLYSEKVLTVEDQKVRVLYCMLFGPYFFEPKWHSFSLFE